MIGTAWKPSKIENDLYDIMEHYEMGFDTYEYTVIDEIISYFEARPSVQWQLDCSEGTTHIAFVDNGTLHMITFEYIHE